MKILAIDTSGQQGNAAILNGYIVAGDISLNAKTGEKSWTHSEVLMPGIDSIFNLSGVSRESIDYIAYTSGPGSFTGLRIGAATALGLANGLNKPSIPVPTLDALAYNMQGMGSNALVIPMMDARREQVYAAIYTLDAHGKIHRQTDYLALPVTEVLAMAGDAPNIFVLGDGACAYKETIQTTLPQCIFLPPSNNRQRAVSVALCAMDQIQGGFTTPENIELLYVRQPQALQDLEKKTQ